MIPRLPVSPTGRALSGAALRTFVAWARDAAVVLWVPWDPARSSANRTRGSHWSKRAELDAVATQAALWAYNAAGDPVLGVPVVVDALILRGTVMDDDNVWSGLKHVRDVLFSGRITPDDSARWVRCGRVEQAPGREWKDAACWTVLFVREHER